MNKSINLQKLKYVIPATSIAILTSANVFAAVENPVVSAISAEVATLKTDAGKVIAGAVGLGLVFWGAKLLFTKFKGMAK